MILLVGCGYMGKEYIKSLLVLKKDFVVVGNSEASVNKIKKEFNIDSVFSRGLSKFFESNDLKFTSAIIATPIDFLEDHIELCIRNNIKNILVEKPGGLDFDRLKKLSQMGSNVYIAYNRRYYDSVLKCQEIIEDDGGVLSFNFEFTELVEIINPSNYSKKVLDNWLLCNSSHVIDLAFYLGGEPEKINCFSTGEIEWHKPAIFSGSGISKNGALFSYLSNWLSQGRWKIELNTKKRRLILCPLEKLKFIEYNSFEEKEVELPKKDNIKDGILNMINIFIKNPDKLYNMKTHIKNYENIYLQIIK